MIDPLLIPIVALASIALVFIVWILAVYWKRLREVQLEIGLKRELLEKGYSAADIERVIRASSKPRKETPATSEVELAEKLMREGHSAQDVEQVLRVFKEGRSNTAIKRADQMVG